MKRDTQFITPKDVEFSSDQQGGKQEMLQEEAKSANSYERERWRSQREQRWLANTPKWRVPIRIDEVPVVSKVEFIDNRIQDTKVFGLPEDSNPVFAGV